MMGKWNLRPFKTNVTSLNCPRSPLPSEGRTAYERKAFDYDPSTTSHLETLLYATLLNKSQAVSSKRYSRHLPPHIENTELFRISMINPDQSRNSLSIPNVEAFGHLGIGMSRVVQETDMEQYRFYLGYASSRINIYYRKQCHYRLGNHF